MWCAALSHAMSRFEGCRALYKQARSGGVGAFTADNFPVFDYLKPNVYGDPRLEPRLQDDRRRPRGRTVLLRRLGAAPDAVPLRALRDRRPAPGLELALSLELREAPLPGSSQAAQHGPRLASGRRRGRSERSALPNSRYAAGRREAPRRRLPSRSPRFRQPLMPLRSAIEYLPWPRHRTPEASNTCTSPAATFTTSTPLCTKSGVADPPGGEPNRRRTPRRPAHRIIEQRHRSVSLSAYADRHGGRAGNPVPRLRARARRG